MRAPIAMRFRPGLLIFVDETGKQICAHLQEIVHTAGLDRTLYQGIALLQLASNSGRAVSTDLAQPISLPDDASSATLTQHIEQEMKEIQSSRHMQNIIEAGYSVPNPRTQIYVIADGNLPALPQILQTVQWQTHAMHCPALIQCVLHIPNTSQVSASAAQNTAATILTEGNHYPQPAAHTQQAALPFCYLYEDMQYYPVPAFVSSDESCYAAAEALFGLIATGLTTEPFYEDLVRPPTIGTAAAYPGIGSLGTSMIRYPETAISNYCATRLSLDMLMQWRHDLQHIPIPPTTRKEIQQRAQQHVHDVQTMPHKQESQQHIMQELHESRKALFTPLTFEHVDRTYKHLNMHDDVEWTEAFMRDAEKSPERYQAWEEAATRVWETATARAHQLVTQTVERLYAREEIGPGLATCYIDTFDQELLATTTQPAHNSDTGQPPPTVVSSVQEIEEQKVQQLKQLISEQQQRIPTLAAQAIIAIPFVIAITMALLSFSWFPQSPQTIFLAISAITLLTVAGHLSFHQRRRQALHKARQQLLAVYRRYYAQCCQYKEEQLQTQHLTTLHTRLAPLRSRLDTLDDYFAAIQQNLEQQAQQQDEHLFHSAAGSRDVFVAHGELLRQGQQHTLADIAEHVTKARTSTPRESWHQTTQALKREFIAMLATQQQSVLEISQASLQQQLDSFTRQVIQPYGKSAQEELYAIMANPDVWREAFMKASSFLYHAPIDTQEPQYICICGSELDLQKGLPYLPDTVYPVHITREQPWVLVVAFSHSNTGMLPGTMETFNAKAYLPST